MSADRKYSRWIDKYCNLALRIVVISLLLIVLLQVLMQFDWIRLVLVPTEHWEGKPLYK